MPYRNLPPDELSKMMDKVHDELADAKRTIMAVRLALVFAACMIAIQIISNGCLVQISDRRTDPKPISVPAEKPP